METTDGKSFGESGEIEENTTVAYPQNMGREVLNAYPTKMSKKYLFSIFSKSFMRFNSSHINQTLQ